MFIALIRGRARRVAALLVLLVIGGCTMMPWDREPPRPDTPESRACALQADAQALERDASSFGWRKYWEATFYDECMGKKT